MKLDTQPEQDCIENPPWYYVVYHAISKGRDDGAIPMSRQRRSYSYAENWYLRSYSYDTNDCRRRGFKSLSGKQHETSHLAACVLPIYSDYKILLLSFDHVGDLNVDP